MVGICGTHPQAKNSPATLSTFGLETRQEKYASYFDVNWFTFQMNQLLLCL